MVELFKHGKKIDNIFQLLGEKENDMSFSLGWGLANSQVLLTAFVRDIIGENQQVDAKQTVIKLQESEYASGITDIELIHPGIFHIIVEVKKGWVLPDEDQLDQYAGRETLINHDCQIKRIVALTEASPEYLDAYFNITEVSGISVYATSWTQVYNQIREASSRAGYTERRLLDELSTYLKKVITMPNFESNWVYVVSLSLENFDNTEITPVEIVEHYSRYFHPVGDGWPNEPPNYIAFRYDGILKSIHHIKNYEVFRNPSDHFEEMPDIIWKPHFLYDLGPAIIPAQEVRSGPIHNSRYYVMIDLLLTSETVKEAQRLSNERYRMHNQ